MNPSQAPTARSVARNARKEWSARSVRSTPGRAGGPRISSQFLTTVVRNDHAGWYRRATVSFSGNDRDVRTEFSEAFLVSASVRSSTRAKQR